MAVIALDLGGTKLAGAVFDEDGEIIARSFVPLAGNTGKAVAGLVCDQIEVLAEAARAKRICIKGVGVSVPGISFASGRVWAPNIPGWRDYPIRDDVRRTLRALNGLGKIPVAIENDRASHILGEVWRGSARGCKNAVSLAVGTGIAAGILANGEVLNGASGIAGSIGWMALDRPYQEMYRGVGCFEYHASGSGLTRQARRSRGLSKDAGPGEIFASFARGERPGKQLVANAIECWGMAVANLVSLFNPEKIIFGGGVFGPAVRFIPAIRREAKKWAQPIAMRETVLCASALGPDAGLYGAGYLAIRARPKRQAA